MRSKTEWAVEQGQAARPSPVRVGLAPEQGKGIEYEFDLLLEISAGAHRPGHQGPHRTLPGSDPRRSRAPTSAASWPPGWPTATAHRSPTGAQRPERRAEAPSSAPTGAPQPVRQSEAPNSRASASARPSTADSRRAFNELRPGPRAGQGLVCSAPSVPAHFPELTASSSTNASMSAWSPSPSARRSSPSAAGGRTDTRLTPGFGRAMTASRLTPVHQQQPGQAPGGSIDHAHHQQHRTARGHRRRGRNDPYDAGDCDISVTRLIGPPQIRVLERQHAEDLTEDASDRIWSLVGQIGHGILERAETSAHRPRRRLFADAAGWRVSRPVRPPRAAARRHVAGLQVHVGLGGRRWRQTRVGSAAQRLALARRRERLPADPRLQIVAILRDWSRARPARAATTRRTRSAFCRCPALDP